MSDAVTWVFRFLHVMSGVLWVGGASLWTMIIAPNVLRRGPPPIRRPFLEAVLSKVTNYLILAGVLTILSGFVVMGLLVEWGNIVAVFQGGGGYPASYGIALGVGFFASVAMLVMGKFVISPTAHGMLATLQTVPAGAPPPPETQEKLAGMGKKLGMIGLATLILGFTALGAMVWAVNTVR